MHRHAGAFADGVKPRHHAVGIAIFRLHDFAVVIGRHTAHHVVAGGHDGNRLLDRINVGKFDRDFAYPRQALVDRVGPEVIELEQHVIFFRPHTAAFFDFLIHGARHHVAAGQVLHVGRIALHEALTVAVDEVAAFATYALGDQHARTGHTGRVKLPEFHVLQR